MEDERTTLSPNGNTSINHESPPTTTHRVLTGHEKFGYSVGHVQNDLCSAAWFTYLLVFMVSVLQMDNRSAGILLLIGQVADALATPFVGIESDRNLDWALCRYGKRKTWHLLGTVCVLFTFPLIFNECIGCNNSHLYAKMIYYSSFIIVFQFGWASVQISHLSLIPDLTPVSSERIELNAYRYAFTVASNILVYVVTWIFLRMSTQSDGSQPSQINPSNLYEFRNVALIIVAVGGVFSLIFHVLVKERHHRSFSINSIEDGPENSAHSFSLNSKRMKWRHWFKVSQFYKIGILYMATRLVVNLTQVYTPFYLQYSLFLDSLSEKITFTVHTVQSIAYIPLVMYLSGFMFSFFIKFINQKAGRKMTYFIGCAIASASFAWLYFGTGEVYRKYEIYGVAILIGFSGSTMLITSLGITNDLIGNNNSSGAFVFGAMSFLDKLSNGVAVMLIQLHHPCERHTCASCNDYYRKILAFVCGGATLLGILALLLLLPNKVGVFTSTAKRGLYTICFIWSAFLMSIDVFAEERNVEQSVVKESESENDDKSPLLRPSDRTQVYEI
ncbi:major facilitator superfamily domain-containing protein 12-like protein [Leptotrombidium deliense]|uniref:Major facilitator superfamily domain-containing protein 12-like protein n=1 Tax=Leptotrombidium deliense TaxID=299467 RepID=A0A443SFH9_9ACAR|nr:major facilitator superfamily domain-containing protein 12-like protein [Leptotrombidium deliense]